MRPWWSLGLLAVPLFLGCAAEKAAAPVSWLERLKPFSGPAGPDVVQMDVYVAERPLGDRYLNEGVWQLDEQAITLEKKVDLEDNRLRGGPGGGLPSAVLRNHLTNPHN